MGIGAGLLLRIMYICTFFGHFKLDGAHHFFLCTGVLLAGGGNLVSTAEKGLGVDEYLKEFIK